jgi:hypothetical protein
VPLAPPVTVIHISPVVAVQLHPAAVVTVTDPVPPVLEKFARAGEIAYVHDGGWCVLLFVDQGAVVTLNGGATWTTWYNQPTAALYHIAADYNFPYRLCSGQQDSGAACVASRGNYGALSIRDWLPVGVDEYGYAAPDPLNPALVYGGRSVSRFDYRLDRRRQSGRRAGAAVVRLARRHSRSDR